MTASPRPRPTLLLAFSCVAFAVASPAPAPADTPALARRLALDGRHGDAALEFRRAAMEDPDPGSRGGFYWAAAYSYWRAGEGALTLKMLDRAEDESPALAVESCLLRGETELNEARVAQARFYFESVATGKGPREARAFANRRLAGIALLDRDLDAARGRITLAAENPSRELGAIDRYARGRDKSPLLGGLLGLVPGLGYAYSGEYANATRSAILNGIFLFGMAHTADKEQWGAFSAIAFFELTWYTGSVYGGIDSAHRHNHNRLADCVGAVQSGAEIKPDFGAIPIVSLTFPMR